MPLWSRGSWAAPAGEGVEEAGAGRGLGEGGLKGIKEGAAGGFGPEGAEETGTEVVGIGDTGTVAGQMARDGEVQQGLEKGVGERGGVQRKLHNNHKTATLTITGAKGNERNRSWFPVAGGAVPQGK